MVDRPPQLLGLKNSFFKMPPYLAAVPLGAAFVDLSQYGKVGALGTGMAVVSDPVIGASLSSNGTTNGIAYPRSAYTVTGMTVAGVFNFTAIASNDVIVMFGSPSNAGSIWRFVSQGVNTLQFRQSGVANVGTAVTVPLGVPVFIFASYTPGTSTPYAYLCRRLDTGVTTIQTGTASVTGGSVGQTNINHGVDASGQDVNGKCAYVIATPFQAMTLAEGLAWADDPWGPFASAPFPLSIRKRVNAAAAGTFQPYTQIPLWGPVLAQ